MVVDFSLASRRIGRRLAGGLPSPFGASRIVRRFAPFCAFAPEGRGQCCVAVVVIVTLCHFYLGG